MDILMMIIYKKVNWTELHERYPPRHGLMVVLEMASMIPMETIYHIANANYFYSRLRYVARMIRIFALLRQKSNIYDPNVDTRALIRFMIAFCVIGVTAACIVIPIECIIEKIEYFNMTDFYILYYTVMSRLTSKGFGDADNIKRSKVYEYVLLCSVNVVAFILTSAFTSHLACLAMSKMRYHFSFAHNFMLITDYLSNWKERISNNWRNYHVTFRNTVIDFFRVTWQNSQTARWKHIPRGRLPDVLIRDIYLDLCWDAFKHSHLFRNERTFFLRYLCMKAKLACYLPGEVVVHRNKPKSMMIYIVSGIMQVISEENNETPILSLSGGTCIGESTLVLDYPSVYTIISKTYSEAIILKKKHFITIYKDHPAVYRSLVKHIHARYKQALKYYRVKNHKMKTNATVYNSETLSINYMKQVAKTLLYNAEDLDNSRAHFQLKSRINKHVFCPYYLDLVTITEELELVSDSVFIKRTFPFILQPNSIVLKWWDAMINCVSAVFILSYPIALYLSRGTSAKRVTLAGILFITGLWTGDIYIKISTAVKKRNVFLTNISSIIYYRLSTTNFVIDLFCVLPMGVLLNVINNDISPSAVLYLEMHKLLKAYRIFQMFQNVGELNPTLMLMIMYLKVFLVTFVLIYYSTFFLFMLTCSSKCPEKYLDDLEMYYRIRKDEGIKIFVHMLTLVSFFVNNTAVYTFTKLLGNHQCLFIIAMQLAYYYTYVFLLAKTIAFDTVNQQEKHEFKEFVSIMSVTKNFNLDVEMEKRVWKYLQDQYYNDMGMSFMNPKRISKLMSKNLYTLFMYVTYGKIISQTRFFHNVSEEIITAVALRATVHIYFSGEVITYAGEISKEMHLIAYGYCYLVSGHDTKKLLGPMDSFSVVDMCLGIPTMNTVIACTDCKIITLHEEDYLRILQKNDEFRREIENACDCCDPTDTLLEVHSQSALKEALHATGRSFTSFRRFKYTLKKSENLEFLSGFGRYCQWMRHVLLRRTLTPYGRFMFWYECARCVLAFGTNLLCTMINTTEMSFFYYILMCFDVTAWIDMYVMHHVCYFNKAGLEISHPMYTAIHYWKHAFLIDFLGSVPIDYIFGVDRSIVVYLRMNRLLQLHRIFGLFVQLNATNIFRTSTFDILKYLPLTVLIMNYVGYLLLHMTCDVNKSFGLETECACRALVFKRMKNTTFNQINAQAASLLLVTGALTMIGITKLRMKQVKEMIFFSVLIVFGAVFSIWLTAKMVANNFYRNSDLTTYQQAMRDLINFYNYRKIDRNIKKEIIEHYEHTWRKIKGKNVHKMLNYFNTCFKEDLLFGIFGKYFKASPIFPNAEQTFFKSLLLEMNYRVYLKRAIIYRVNDIHGKIFFLLCGEIDVLGPDYNKLTKLTSGSLFGSLDDCEYTRQTLMMVAKSNVELLEIPSVRFHYILSKYRLLYNHFRRETAFDVDYIQSHVQVKKSHTKVYATVTNTNKLYNMYAKLNPLLKNNSCMVIWTRFLLICVDFLGFHLELYQKVTWDISVPLLICLYFFDVLYLTKIYLSFHTCYKDEFGTIIKDRGSIAARYINDKTRFYLDIISTVPLEFLAVFISDFETRLVVFTFCRINRTLRIFFVCTALKNTGEKLDIHVVLMRILLIFTWLSIYIHICTVIFYHIRALLRVRRPQYSDSLTLYLTSLYIMGYTSIGTATNAFDITYSFGIVIYTASITIIARFIITLFIAETCVTIESMNKNRNLYKQFSVNLLNFIQGRDVSAPIVKEISHYVQMLWIHHRGIHIPQLLEEAPHYLKEATMNAMFGYHLRQHPILRKCHVDLIRQMAAEMRLLVFFPGNHIAYEGDIDRCMYFIHEGMVDALSKDTLEYEAVVKTLVAGNCFGLIQGLHSRMGHNYTYKVRKHAIINVLDRQKWFHMLVFFPASKTIIDECLRAAENGQVFD